MKIKNLLIISLIFFCFACAKNAKFGDETKKVRVTPAVTHEQPDETSGFGSLSFLTKVDVTSPQEAVIKKLYFREGDYVRQGQLIIQLENPQIVLAVERAENNYSQTLAARNLAESRLLEGVFQAEAQLLTLDKADAELALSKKRWEEDRRKHLNQETLFEAGGVHTEAILVSRFTLDSEWEQIQLMERELEIRRVGCRNQDLVKAGIPVPLGETEKRAALVSLMTASLRAELESANARNEAAEKELKSARIALAELTIKSPAGGIIGARYLEEGERVRLQDKILSLIDTESLYAIFPVREKDALRIEKGMKAFALIDGTGETRTGAVDLIYPQADSQSLSFLVRVLLQNTSANTKLKPGMFTRVTINLGPPQNAVFIPESSIFNQKNNEGRIFIVNGKSLTEQKIIIGTTVGEECEITSGIKSGELVVLRPDPDLREGANVSIIE
jgi:HlyD family secretion protein